MPCWVKSLAKLKGILCQGGLLTLFQLMEVIYHMKPNQRRKCCSVTLKLVMSKANGESGILASRKREMGLMTIDKRAMCMMGSSGT